MTNVAQQSQSAKINILQIEVSYAERLEEARIKLCTAYNVMMSMPTEGNTRRWRQRKIELLQLLASNQPKL